jgi:hypothetical protein
LQQALVSRPVIDQALGIIMSGHKVDAAAAAPPMVASLVAPGRRLPDGHDDLTVPHHRRTRQAPLGSSQRHPGRRSS